MNWGLAIYIFNHYGHLRNDAESRALSHFIATGKLQYRMSTPEGQERYEEMLSRSLTTDPEALKLLRDGYQAFVERTAERILAEHKDAIILNYCPSCHQIARTPSARQCRFCRYDWHREEQNLQA